MSYKEEVICKDCFDPYFRNGPGSEVGVSGKFTRWLAYKLLPTAQELFLEASKKHDDDFHVGPTKAHKGDWRKAFAEYNQEFLQECLLAVKSPPKGLKGRWKVKMFPGTFREIAYFYFYLITTFGAERFEKVNCVERKNVSK
jgi:hypothetical protein